MIIEDLEENKGRVTKKFIDQREAFRQLKRSLARKNARQLVAQVQKKKQSRGGVDSSKKMQSPLSSFLSMKKDANRKGVIYRFSDGSPLYSGRSGRVQYLGKLANYGNLLIVNHGSDIRSIFLGDIHLKVKKGERVRRGQILGYTKASLSGEGELYFEIRVKNRPHNTLSWIDQSSFSTNPQRRI